MTNSAPVPGAAADFSFPDFAHHRAESGIDTYVMSVRRTPLVTARLVLPAGAHFDPADRPGLAAFTAALLEEGTETRSSEEIALVIESLGGRLGSGAGWNSSAVSVDCMAQHLDTALELLVDIAIAPAFATEEIERARRERLAEWLRRRDQPGALAEEAFARAVYESTPYDHPLLGDRVALEAIDRDQIRHFWAEQRGLAGATLVVAGDVSARDILDRVGTWNGFDGDPQPLPQIKPEAPRRRVLLVDRPAAAQTEIRVGHIGPPKPHPDRTVLQVANSLLGGKFTSRINLNLREKHGYTYGAHSSFVARRGPGPFMVWSAVETASAGAAVREILGELERIRQEDVTAAELEETQTYIRGVFPYGMQSLSGALRRLQDLAVYRLDDDHFQRYLEDVAAVTAGQIRDATATHLRPADASIIAVGPAEDLAGQLDELGPVEVVRPSGRERLQSA